MRSIGKILDSIPISDANKVTTSGNKITFEYPCESLTDCSPYEVLLQQGRYVFELWGSQGGDARNVIDQSIQKNTGGKGAFVSGRIKLTSPTKVFLYIGAKGEDQDKLTFGAYSRGGFNGGADGGADLNTQNESPPYESSAGGGGSTDVRLVKGDSAESLQSRIIVAGAGGGASSIYGASNVECTFVKESARSDGLLCSETSDVITLGPYGGPAGALEGFRTSTITYPGNQTRGSFGMGGKGISISAYPGGSTGGGGSGYFGGTSASRDLPNRNIITGGAGGSSYVSGCQGCRSIIPGTASNETSEDPIHSSKLSFSAITMYTGVDTFLSPSGEEEEGHSGNGAIAITYFPLNPYTCNNGYTRFVQSLLYSLTSFISRNS